ncbi:MAG: alkaline phosphatase D family protein [Gammaproteobacteria bacterium]
MTSRRTFLAASLSLAGAACTPLRRVDAARKFSSDPFTLGIASGYPTSDGIVLWTRLVPEPLTPDGGMRDSVVPVQWEIATDEKMTAVIRKGTEYATSEWAHSVHVELEGLEPSRDYWYRFTAGHARSVIGRTRTAPPSRAPLASLKVAVASCQQYEHGYFNAYRQMIADNPDLIVHVGDYIYELSWGETRIRHHNTPETFTLEDYRARYALYKSDADLAAAHAACPWLVIWDDHEVENDYAGDTSEEDDEPGLFLARRAAAYRAYYEHMPLPRRMVPFGPQMRLHTQRAFGDLASIYLIDQRQYRSREACPPSGRAGSSRVTNCAELDLPERTMLGTRQEAWLHAALGRSRTRWNLLAQGTVMAHIDEKIGADKAYWTDAWNGYPAARSRLVNYLSEHEVANPVVLSGDIHAFMVNQLNLRPDDLESPVVAAEFVTTSISSQGTPQKVLDTWRASNANLLFADGEHRGYTRLDLTHERMVGSLIAMDSVTDPHAMGRALKTVVVEAGRPEPKPA